MSVDGGFGGGAEETCPVVLLELLLVARHAGAVRRFVASFTAFDAMHAFLGRRWFADPFGFAGWI